MLGFDLYLFCFVFCFLGSHLCHVEIPRLAVESELQPLAYTTATGAQAPQLAEQGQGSNPHPHRYQLDSLPRHHNGNSLSFVFLIS